MHEGEFIPSHARETYESDAGIVGYRGGHMEPNCKWWNHMSAEQVRAELGDDLWSQYFKFCVVRNPFEQLVSYFYFLRRESFTPQFDERHKDEFARWLTTEKLPSNEPMYKIAGENCMDFLVRFENLQGDLQRVCSHIGVDWKPSELSTYKSGFRPAEATAAKIYTEPARQFVERQYAQELRYLGYSFPQ